MRVVYSQRQSVQVDPKEIGLGIGLLSPSVNKPELVVAEWAKQNISMTFVPPTPCTPADLTLAHAGSYVEGVLKRQIQNGHGTFHQEVIDTLYYTTGSLVTAALLAVETGKNYASPTSGFHHASYSSGEGYCTFNGLVVAARKVQLAYGLKTPVVILDCDDHYANGTVNILEHLDLVNIRQWNYGQQKYQIKHVPDFLKNLSRLVEFLVQGAAVCIYQAGVDSHIHDPYGSRTMMTSDLALRDRIVFETCAKLHVPVVWNLAGGYQQPIQKVLELHTQTARIASEIEG